ncbi:MAG: HPr kinase/phosphatase C-terminal domain-containing protein [Pseudomonadota bacterium]|nr:HPr kinase/phosphatase C-terminal domain-containing protein [Pseudomonadota bacterium]
MTSIHASCVAVGSHGILMRGASGSGKSTLCLQLIDGEGYGLGRKTLRARLVADDQVELFPRKGKLVARPPASLAGLIEIRGAGILATTYKKSVILKLVVDLLPPTQVERLPDQSDQQTEIEGIKLPRIAIAAGNPAAAAIVRSALQYLV